MRDDGFDVFISYNSRDRETVLKIAEALQAAKLRVWFDRWLLPPGQSWITDIQEGLAKSASVAVFIGPSGPGGWENSEMELALNDQVERGIPIIPVLLPGLPGGPVALKGFLKRFTAVDFRAGFPDPREFDRLKWGITRVNPLALALAPAAAAVTAPASDPLNEIVEQVVEAFKTEDVTFLLGRTIAEARSPQSPAPCELSARFLNQLGLMKDGYEGFVPDVESVAALVVATSSEAMLENQIRRWLTPEIDPRPAVHPALARLMRLLNQRPAERRPRRRAPSLILSTNFDLLMERALMRAGVPFSRLVQVQYRAEPRIDINRYDQVALSADGKVLIAGRAVALHDTDELDYQIYEYGQDSVRLDPAEVGQSVANPLESLTIFNLGSPILYKFHGSQDIPNSIAISADQCFEFAWRLLKQDCVPNQITEIIGNSVLIVLGSSVLDSDFRLTYHTLLRGPLSMKRSMRLAVVSRQDVDQRDYTYRMNEQKWGAIREMALKNYGIKIIDCRAADFLARVTARLEDDWRIYL